MTTTTRFELLSWGANSHHQLSQGRESEQCAIPLAVNLNDSELRASDIAKVVGGAGHTVILTLKGDVWACGLNDKGQGGVQAAFKKHIEKLKPLNRLLGKRIVDVACGWDSSAAIDEHGDLYVWGSNAYGQLGIDGEKLIREPKKVELDFPVARVAMGLRHSAIVNGNGDVLVTGSGNKCQLGITDLSNNPLVRSEKFLKVTGLRDYGIRAISCGQHHTLALGINGDVYAWGDNRFGQIGFDPSSSPRVKTPEILDNVNFGSEGEIFSGWTHNVALCSDGKLYVWGRNTYGQLGRSLSKEFSKSSNHRDWIPESIEGVPRFVKLAVGSEHNVALSDDGRIISWGWNEHGNCGNGDELDVRIPGPVKTTDPENGRGLLVGAGAGHSFAVFRRN